MNLCSNTLAHGFSRFANRLAMASAASTSSGACNTSRSSFESGNAWSRNRFSSAFISFDIWQVPIIADDEFTLGWLAAITRQRPLPRHLLDHVVLVQVAD